jgi:hypothetical protein
MHYRFVDTAVKPRYDGQRGLWIPRSMRGMTDKGGVDIVVILCFCESGRINYTSKGSHGNNR